jgi:hypothetical protein
VELTLRRTLSRSMIVGARSGSDLTASKSDFNSTVGKRAQIQHDDICSEQWTPRRVPITGSRTIFNSGLPQPQRSRTHFGGYHWQQIPHQSPSVNAASLVGIIRRDPPHKSDREELVVGKKRLNAPHNILPFLDMQIVKRQANSCALSPA